MTTANVLVLIRIYTEVYAENSSVTRVTYWYGYFKILTNGQQIISINHLGYYLLIPSTE